MYIIICTYYHKFQRFLRILWIFLRKLFFTFIGLKFRLKNKCLCHYVHSFFKRRPKLEVKGCLPPSNFEISFCPFKINKDIINLSTYIFVYFSLDFFNPLDFSLHFLPVLFLSVSLSPPLFISLCLSTFLTHIFHFWLWLPKSSLF